jgi:hypothetical protein
MRPFTDEEIAYIRQRLADAPPSPPYQPHQPVTVADMYRRMRSPGIAVRTLPPVADLDEGAVQDLLAARFDERTRITGWRK